jgi:aconitate hydratase
VAAASALTGKITDPTSLKRACPRVKEPFHQIIQTHSVLPPPEKGEPIPLDKGENIKPLPHFEPLPESLKGPVLIKLGDNISTDEIMPAGAKVLPFRSNIPAIAEFVFAQVDESYPQRAKKYQDTGHVIIGGKNYGQGSSREHAAIAPRFLGVRVVIAKSFARIHRSNLTNFGIVPLLFENEQDWDQISQMAHLNFPFIRDEIQHKKQVTLIDVQNNRTYHLRHNLTPREISSILEGGMIGQFRKKTLA